MRIVILLLAALAVAANATAAAPKGKVEFLSSGKVLPSKLPFSEAVRVGDVVFLSGQVGIAPGTMKVVEGGIKEETRQSLGNIKTTLSSHGYTMDDLVKCTVMLADIGEWAAMNEVYKTFFTDHFPARSAFGTSGLALNARVEIECIAAAK